MMASMSDVNGMSGPDGSVSADQDSPGSAGWRGSAGPGGPPSGKRLERKLNNRWVAGVCAGLADYTGLDATLIRVIFAVLTFVGGLGPIAYVLGWALIPEEGESASIAERFINKSGT
jgi:phage shock protein C